MSQFSMQEMAIIALVLDEEENMKKKRRYWVHRSLRLRKIEGEFHTLYRQLLEDEEKLYQYFRMSSPQFHILLKNIQGIIQKNNTKFREVITPIEKLAVCLRYLSTGDSFRTIAFSYRLGETTVRKIVKEVCGSIIKTMKSKYLPTPSKEHWKQIANDFWTRWNFPNCIGAIDGKHVVIKAPSNSGSLYFNYKKTFSVVLLALVDANYKFIAVDVGSYGKNSDGGIFANSKLGKAVAQKRIAIPEDKNLPGTDIKMPFVIVGDEAFPLKTYLLRPFPGSQIADDHSKRVFNYRLSRARRVVENAFGILSQKFRIYDRRLNLNPDFAILVILTTCILHNFIRSTETPNTHFYDSEENQGSVKCIHGIRKQGGSANNLAFTIRETFAQYFLSPYGRVEWQNNV